MKGFKWLVSLRSCPSIKKKFKSPPNYFGTGGRGGIATFSAFTEYSSDEKNKANKNLEGNFQQGSRTWACALPGHEKMYL